MVVPVLIVLVIAAFCIAARQYCLRCRAHSAHLAAMRARSRLAEEVAHELKNPITAILCSAETLEIVLGPKLDESERRCLTYIREYGDMVLRLVSNYLDLSLTDGDLSHGKPEPINAGEVIDGVVGLLQTSALRKQVELLAVGSTENVWTEIDPRHLRQILFNLIHNAIKFTPAGGQVSVTLGEELERQIISVAVRDTGPGMNESEVNELFTSHRSSKPKRPGQGTGLGLMLTKRLVELAHGKICVITSPGNGAAFSIELPRVNPPRTVTIEAANSTRPLEGMSVLVVDSNSGTSAAVSTLIESLGGVVDKVSMAIDAVDAIANKEYTAVVIDNTIDGMNGSELAHIIKTDNPGSNARIVVAGEGQTDPVGSADRYVTKPLNGKTLLGSLLDS